MVVTATTIHELTLHRRSFKDASPVVAYPS